jgi:hypothetical protein
LLVVAIADFNSSTKTTLSDSRGNTWTELTQSAVTSGTRTRIFYCFSPSVGSGHTFTSTQVSGSPYQALAVAGFSGTSGTYDKQNGATTASGTTLATGSVTPASADSLVVAAWGSTATSTCSVDSSMSIASQLAGVASNSFAIALAYKIQGASAINPTFTWTGSAGSAARIAVLK